MSKLFKNKKKKRENKSKWLWEFSKKLLVICFLIYIAHFIFACVAMWHFHDISYLSTFVEQTTDMLKFAVVGYLGKAGIENVFKIKNNTPPSDGSDDSFDGGDSM